MSAGPSLGAAVHLAPPAGGRLRLAFVGQATFFEACMLGSARPDIVTTFIDFRRGGDGGALRRELDAFTPHVVVVFRPEAIPHGALEGMPAVLLGFLTEPIPRTQSGAHHDLERRLWELRAIERDGFDRVVSFDPLIAATAEKVMPVWRAVPLPVSDRYFRPVRPVHGRPRGLVVGRSTPHREELLADVKASRDVLHLAFGVDADELERLLDEHAVGINLHNDTYLSFENRVALHLAAGHLVISEPLKPAHGLESGIDFLEIGTGGEIWWAIECMTRFPGLYDRIRLRGRLKAEQFRASHVWPRLLEDLAADVAAFGTPRTVRPQAAIAHRGRATRALEHLRRARRAISSGRRPPLRELPAAVASRRH